MQDSQQPELPASFHTRAEVLADTLNSESDRGSAIIGAQIMSDRLESLLRAFFRSDAQSRKQIDPLFKGFGPVSTFSTRIQMAYVMYLIPRIIRDRLEMIRKIRNHFAHSPTPAKFTDAQCKETLHILATGKFRVTETTEPASNGRRKNRGQSPKNAFTSFVLLRRRLPLLSCLSRFFGSMAMFARLFCTMKKRGHSNMTKTPPNERLQPTRLAPPVYSCVTRRAAQAQRWTA
jgi:DNA-binding MltR family transcriptional regulator